MEDGKKERGKHGIGGERKEGRRKKVPCSSMSYSTCFASSVSIGSVEVEGGKSKRVIQVSKRVPVRSQR